MKVVISVSFGGFGLSGEAMVFLDLELPEDELSLSFESYKPPEEYNYASKLIDGELVYDWSGRANPKLIECVEKLGSERASGRFAKLKVVEIPDDVEWQIEEYDGAEWIAEKHRRWS